MNFSKNIATIFFLKKYHTDYWSVCKNCKRISFFYIELIKKLKIPYGSVPQHKINFLKNINKNLPTIKTIIIFNNN